MSSPPPPPPAYGWVPPAVPRNGQGTAALIVGIAALLLSITVILFFVGGPLGIVGLVLGILALGRVRRGEANNRGVAIAAIVLSSLAVVVSAVLLVIGIFGVAVFNEVSEDASVSVSVEPTSDAAAEGWAALAVRPGEDAALDDAVALAAWVLPDITRDGWPKQRVISEAGNVAAAVQSGADPQTVVDDLMAQGLGQTAAVAFATLAVDSYCTQSVADTFNAALT